MAVAPWQIVDNLATLRTANFSATIDPHCPSAGLRIESVCGLPIAGASLFAVQLEPSSRANNLVGDPSAIDCFVRGNDLVATYAETAERPFRAQIYWRLINSHETVVFADVERHAGNHLAVPPMVVLELIVSVQTSRLDLDTALAVCTTFGHVESWQLLDTADDRLAVNGKKPTSETQKIDGPTNLPSTLGVVPDFDGSESRDCCLIRPLGSLPSYIEMVHPSDFRQTMLDWTSGSLPTVQLTHRLFVERLEKGVILRSRIRGVFVQRDRADEFVRREYRSFAHSELPLTA